MKSETRKEMRPVSQGKKLSLLPFFSELIDDPFQMLTSVDRREKRNFDLFALMAYIVGKRGKRSRRAR